MDLRPKFRADRFIYAAENKDIEKIQREVQKKLEDKDVEKELEGLKDFEKANAILSFYAYIAYDEGYRKGLKELSSEHIKVKAQNRNKENVKYAPSKEDSLKLTKLTQRRLKSKRQRKYRTDYCLENGVENSEESFALSMTIHTFFEAGYVDIAFNTDNMFKEMHKGNEEKADSLSRLFDEVFSEVLK